MTPKSSLGRSGVGFLSLGKFFLRCLICDAFLIGEQINNNLKHRSLQREMSYVDTRKQGETAFCC